MDNILGKIPNVFDIIRENKFLANKNLGQNFLIDENILQKIISFAGIQENDTIIEIGGGLGSLTKYIAISKAKKLIIVEKDKRFLDILNNIKNIVEDENNIKIEIIHANALDIKLKDLSSEKVRIIANLPYNIATKLITNWAFEADLIQSGLLMVQKEVAEKIISKEGKRNYGKLAVICQSIFECKKLFNVSQSAFIPSPKVISSIVSLKTLENKQSYDNLEKLLYIMNKLFNNKRKKIGKQISYLFGNDFDYAKYNISPDMRVDEISVDIFCKLIDKIAIINKY
jgi:16S rRNA (adenine1518-N6/adenine1519-N6)-dimethyltransferase